MKLFSPNSKVRPKGERSISFTRSWQNWQASCRFKGYKQQKIFFVHLKQLLKSLSKLFYSFNISVSFRHISTWKREKSAIFTNMYAYLTRGVTQFFSFQSGVVVGILGTLRSTTRRTRRRGLNFSLKMSADLFML